MMRRPTFDAIAYCPDLEERLTLPQATVLVDRIAPRIPSLSRLVVAEVHARNFILYPGETGVVLFPPDALARQSDRREFPEQAMVGRITYREFRATQHHRLLPLRGRGARREVGRPLPGSDVDGRP